MDPTRVLGLVLADTYAGWTGSLGEEAAKQRLARCVRESSMPAEEFVARWVPVEFFTEAVPRQVQEAMAAVVRDFHALGFRLMAKALADSDTTELLPHIEVPTLLLWGHEDRRSPLSVAERFQDAIPGSRLAVIPRAGHLSNMEQPEIFNAHVRRFCMSQLAT